MAKNDLRFRTHTRFFRTINQKKAGWFGISKWVRIFRHRGEWAFYDGQGFMWCVRVGFKTPLAATRAAARHMGKWYRLRRDIQGPQYSGRPPLTALERL